MHLETFSWICNLEDGAIAHNMYDTASLALSMFPICVD